MNKKLTILIISIFCLALIASPVSFAEDNSSATTSTSTKDNSSQFEISFPIQKDDFLLFYGTTKDKDTNDKIDSLRKDFMDKFQSLKADYQKSMSDALGDNVLTSPVSVDSKDIQKIDSQIKKTDTSKLKIGTKKYSIKSDKATSTDIIISPVVNIIDNSSSIRTENSTWFHKIKSIFNW